jgi:hypothetical protein
MATAEPKDELSARPEHDLVENIARAMQHRPLMRRLANVDGAADQGFASPSAFESAPAISDSLAPSDELTPMLATSETELERMQRRVAEAEEWTLPPRSAEWLDKAQRERNRARLRNFLAWVATLTIGAAIIAVTALIVQP